MFIGQRAQPQVSAATKAIYYHNNENHYVPHQPLEYLPPQTTSTPPPQKPMKYSNGSNASNGPHHQTSNSSSSIKLPQQSQSPRHSINYSQQQPQQLRKAPQSSVNAYDVQKAPPKYIPSSYITNYDQKPPGMNISMNPSYIEEFNGSDYVCMTGGHAAQAAIAAAAAAANANSHSSIIKSLSHSQVNAQNKILLTNIATSSPTLIGTPKHISSTTPTAAIDTNMSPVQQRDVAGAGAAVSPTPSQLSSESGSGKRKFIYFIPSMKSVHLVRARKL